MPLTHEHGAGWVRSEDAEIDRQLREGDGLVWKGDPSLWLGYGVLTAPKRMQHPVTGRWLNKGDLIAKRYEVWRHTEEGLDVFVNHWKMDEYGRILFDIAGQKAGFEGRAPSAEERIDKNNAAVEKRATDAFRDSYAAMYEHMHSIVQERTQGRLTHRGVGGSNEDAGRNLAKA